MMLGIWYLRYIADAIARSNNYARAEHIKGWILEIKCNYGFFGIHKIIKVLWSSSYRNNTKTITAMFKY